MTTSKAITKLRIHYRSLYSNPNNRNQEPQEVTSLRFNYINVAKSPAELTFGELKQELKKELATRLGRPNADFVSYLTGQDEVEIDAECDQLVLNQVLQSNTLNERLDDIIMVYEPKLLSRKLLPTLDINEPLALFEKADTGDNTKRSIQVGLQQYGKLFLRVLNGGTVSRLVLYSPSQLSSIFTQLKKQLSSEVEHASLPILTHTSLDEYHANFDCKVASSKTFSGLDWYADAKFVLTKKNEANTMNILLSIKVSNEETPALLLVPLKWTEFRVLRKGAAVEIANVDAISTAFVEVEPPKDAVALPYKLRQSSKYSSDSIAHTYEALQDEKGENGAATNNDNKPYFQATFDHPHTVCACVVKPLLQSGWGAEYLTGAYLLYSHDEIEWKKVLQLNGITDNSTTFVVPNIAAPYWRIRKEGQGYLSIGHLKFLGVPSEDPIPQVPAGKPLDYYKTLLSNTVTNSKEGGELNTGAPRLNCQKYQDCGESSFNLLVAEDDQNTLNNLVEATQDSWERDGKFNNYFKFPLTVLNKGSDMLSFVKIEMAYKNASGEWVPMQNVKLGARYPRWSGGFDYSFFDSPVMNFKAGAADNLVFCGSIEVVGKPGIDFNARNRAHHSLPQPLVIRTTVHDSDNKTREIFVEQTNKPLYLTDVKEFASNNSVDVSKVRFVTCDDVDTLDRTYVAVYLHEKDRVLYVKSSGTSYAYTFDDLQSFVSDAKKNAKEEVELTDIGSDNRHVYFRFDPASEYKLYAARVVMKSATTKVEEGLLIKDLVDELAKL
ncbi:hypothetical protein C9374_013411 [Naegleria lovaniensis]|uniref:Uncharacterized protein n=1 Tax=Naegleria lovaniensis TaxID=51637 RepID=A0AA88KPX6_NAELO|nr:uncharacterized protein C9374_013411 [Naegleria lovaniensis]KAG2391926.1 hypothetical protein C9374_013411 [Naegleria lovaniensis]